MIMTINQRIELPPVIVSALNSWQGRGRIASNLDHCVPPKEQPVDRSCVCLLPLPEAKSEWTGERRQKKFLPPNQWGEETIRLSNSTGTICQMVESIPPLLRV